jgi:hypothetical protein
MGGACLIYTAIICRQGPEERLNGKLLRLKKKKLTRQYESGEGRLTFGGATACVDWHYSYGEGGNAKGMNILAGFYTAGSRGRR